MNSHHVRQCRVSAIAALVTLAVAVWAPLVVAAQELRVEVVGQSEDEAVAQAEIFAALERPVEVSFFDDSLADVMEDLAAQQNIEIEIDEEALDDAALDSEIPITREVQGVSLGAALELILSEYDLTYTLREEKLIITTPESAGELLITRRYHCPTLLELPGTGEGWVDVITFSVAPDSWEEWGGAAEIAVSEDGESLVVSQTMPIHGILENLLRQAIEIQATLEAGEAPEELQIFFIGQTQQEREAAAALRQALAADSTHSFFEDSLLEVMMFFEAQHGIEIEIDGTALDDAGLGADIPVTSELSDITLAATLDIIRSEYDLTYAVRNEVLLITTPEELENNLQLRLYTCQALRELSDREMVELLDLIPMVIEPTCWCAVGGLGEVDCLPDPRGLVVAQTDSAQEQVESLLRKLFDPPAAEQAAGVQVLRVGAAGPAADRELAILATLQEPTKFNFDATPLADAMQCLAALHDIPIVIAETALDDAGLAVDVPLTVAAEEVTLQNGLEKILDSHDLAWCVRNEVLLITSHDDCESHGTVCVYRGDSLADLGRAEADALLEAIINDVEPESWFDVGGPGSLAYCQAADALVVLQSDRIQLQVEAYLRQRATEAP